MLNLICLWGDRERERQISWVVYESLVASVDYFWLCHAQWFYSLLIAFSQHSHNGSFQLNILSRMRYQSTTPNHSKARKETGDHFSNSIEWTFQLKPFLVMILLMKYPEVSPRSQCRGGRPTRRAAGSTWRAAAGAAWPTSTTATTTTPSWTKRRALAVLHWYDQCSMLPTRSSDDC